MANAQHLDVLKGGRLKMLAWRGAHPSVRLDLSGATLSGMDILGLDLSDADLTDADLSNSQLVGANLTRADLSRATLYRTNLALSNLSSANLSESRITRSNFCGADLSGANLTRAIFQGIGLSYARLNASAGSVEFRDSTASYFATGVDGSLLSRGMPLYPIDWVRDLVKNFTVNDGRLRLAFTSLAARVPGFLWRLSLLLLRFVSWPLVRAIGSLQLLTKASYIALFIVPLLAAVWPIVVRAIDGYNDALTRSESVLGRVEAELSRLETHIENLPDSTRGDILAQAETVISELRRARGSLGTARVSTAALPLTLVAGFFAALAIAIGHLVYQMFADSLVKEISETHFVRQRVSEYIPAPAGSFASLDSALFQIREAAARYPDEYHPQLVNHAGRLVWLPSSAADLLLQPADRQWIAIEAAAIREYAAAARRALPGAIVSLLSYTTGILLLLYIVVRQGELVLKQGQLLP